MRLKTIVVLIGLGLIVSGCAKKIDRESYLNLDRKLNAATMRSASNTLFLLSDAALYGVDIRAGVKKIDKVGLPENGFHEIACVEEECWIGGGYGPHGELLIYDANRRHYERVMNAQFAEVHGIVPYSDKYIVTVHGSGEVIVWDRIRKEKFRSFGNRQIEVYAVDQIAGSNLIVTGDYDGVLSIWNIESGDKIGEVKINEDNIFTVATGNNIIYCGTYKGRLYIFDKDAKMIKSYEIGYPIFTSDIYGDRYVCGLTKGFLGVVKLDKNESRISKQIDSDIIYIKFINNGNDVLLVGRAGEIRILNFEAIGL